MQNSPCIGRLSATFPAWVRALAWLAIMLAPTAWAAGADSVAALRAAVKSGDESAKLAAIDDLAELGAEAKDAIGDLTAQLSDKSPAVRAHAAYALGEIGKPARGAGEALAKVVADPDVHARRAAIHALETIGASADVAGPAFGKALADPDPSVQVAALDALTDLGPAGVPTLSAAVANPATRYWAALALGELGPAAKPAVEPLAASLDEKRPDVLREVLIALGRIGPDAAPAVKSVTPLLTSDDQAVRNGAAYALGQIGPAAAESADALRTASNSDDELLPTIASWAIARIEPDNKPAREEAVKLLTVALKHKNPRVQLAALRGLLSLGVPPAQLAPDLAEMICDCQPEMAHEVMDVLAAAGDAATPALIAALQSPSACGRAAILLERIGPKAADAVPALMAAAADKNPDVRREVLYALGSILADKGPANEVIVAALDDPDERVRATAAYALGRIGPSAQNSAPKLRQSLESPDGLVRVVSAWALAHVTPDDAQAARAAVPVLMQGLKNDRVEVRRGSADALGKFGKAAGSATGALQAATRDPDETVRAAALEALERIGAVVEKVPRRAVRRKQ